MSEPNQQPIVYPMVTSAAIEQITPLLEQLRASLSDPTVQALRQRDAFQQAWETAVHDLLKNMEEIRGELSAIRVALYKASTAGSADTEKILEAVREYHRYITDYLETKRRSWFRRLWERLV